MILVIKRNLEDLYLYRECTVKRLHEKIEIMAPGGRVFPYFGYAGTCRWTGHGFFGLAVLNRVYSLTCLCPEQV